MQKFSDPILTACPTCKKPVEKLISAPAIRFKGTGWYVTDYAKKSGGEKDNGEPKAKTTGEAKDGGSSKDKPAKKDSSSSPSSSKGSSSK